MEKNTSKDENLLLPITKDVGTHNVLVWQCLHLMFEKLVIHLKIQEIF